jgi:hypothetical protein
MKKQTAKVSSGATACVSFFAMGRKQLHRDHFIPAFSPSSSLFCSSFLSFGEKISPEMPCSRTISYDVSTSFKISDTFHPDRLLMLSGTLKNTRSVV